jgi:hypothetical protein
LYIRARALEGACSLKISYGTIAVKWDYNNLILKLNHHPKRNKTSGEDCSIYYYPAKITTTMESEEEM